MPPNRKRNNRTQLETAFFCHFVASTNRKSALLQRVGKICPISEPGPGIGEAQKFFGSGPGRLQELADGSGNFWALLRADSEIRRESPGLQGRTAQISRKFPGRHWSQGLAGGNGNPARELGSALKIGGWARQSG